MFIFASYIRSADNTEADEGSRLLAPETEWELCSSAFRKIKIAFGNPEMDLFATKNNAKCSKFVSWMRDPDAVTVDAFTLSWSGLDFYALPPFAIILRILQKIINDKAEGIVVVPYWPSQPWFPLFTAFLVEKPILFEPRMDLLSSFVRKPLPLWRTITLVAGPLSYRRYADGRFQNLHKTSAWLQSLVPRSSNTIVGLGSGGSSANNTERTPFLYMFRTYWNF